MSKRLLVIVLFLFLPIAATAETVPASELGPQSTTSGGGSTTDSSALQPAGTGPQQPAGASGLTAPSSVLQAPAASSAQLQVIAADSDGPTHQTDESPAGFGLALIGASALILLICAIFIVLRDRKRFLESDPFRI